MSTSTYGDTATKSAGLLDRFKQGSTILSLKICMKIFGLLEELNRSCQFTSGTVSGMLEVVDKVKAELMRLRESEHWIMLYNEVNAIIEKHELEPLTIPRQKRPPKRYSGNGAAHAATTAEDHFRPIYFAVIDTAHNQLHQRLDRSTPGIETYLALERMLLASAVDINVCSKYPELERNMRSLEIQLAMFHSSYTVKSLSVAQAILQEMKPEVRELFNAVEQLVRLMLVCPLSSCAAERSFSALRRLKTWLRSTMTERRLNDVTVCHVNKGMLDNVDIVEVAADFVKQSSVRVGTFGSFSN
jgi:hypothetical protein